MVVQHTDGIKVAARRWDSTRTRFSAVAPGTSLECIVLDAIQSMQREGLCNRAYARRTARYARCRVNGIEIKRSQWATTFPQQNARIEVIQGVKGGGGGGGSKNPVATVLSVVIIAAAAAATWYIGGAGGYAAAAGWSAAQTGLVMAGIGLAASGALMAVNALFPAATPTLSLGDVSSNAANASQVYSITGAKNTANPRGYIPLVCGKHRHTPPLGAKSWTVWEGDKQFFNMLVVWGHPDIAVSDFRIGDTPLANYSNVDHQFHQSSYGNDLKYFAKSYNEKSVGAVLKKSSGWVTRTVGEAEDISIDIACQQGLCSINQSNGDIGWRTVDFLAQYRERNTETWYGLGGSTFGIAAASGLTVSGIRESDGVSKEDILKVYVSRNGIISAGANIGGDAQLYPYRSGYVTGCNVSVSWTRTDAPYPDGYGPYGTYTASVSVTSGTYDDRGHISISGATTSPLVRNFRFEGFSRKDYEARLIRLTDDTGSQYIRDEATWAVSRAILNQPAFATRKPYCVSELRIQANEQLSSYVDDFNALCHSKLPDWDGSAWTTRTTSNPASIARYLLTSTHGLAKPYSTAKMDDSAWVALWNWCNANGYEFNFICDSEQATWARLVQILAAGRAAPTTDVDGLWGAVIDRSGKEVKQLFTPRNSWGINCNRTFYDAPHALRVSYIDAADKYATKENFVFSDGYSNDGANGTTKATDIIEWDYPGVTNWEKIWRMGRYHLAKLLHRQMSVTINTDWEWLVCHRGDLVGIASDVLMNTYGTARIQRLVYDVDGVETLVGKAANIPVDEDDTPLIPIGVQLDDAVIFSDPAPARYGLAVRYATGAVSSYEVVPVFDDEPHSVLYFKNPITLAQTPPFYGLCDVGVFGEEYEEYLLAGVQPGDNASAELTLIPYAATEIEAAASGAVPDYKPTVILDVIKSSNLPTPVIEHIRSDETVLISASSGGTTPRIAAWWSFSASTGDTSTLTMQISATDVETNAAVFGSASVVEDYVACAGVTEGRLYNVRVRAVDGSTGKTSAWSTPIKHVCIGRTTLPPAPSSVYLDGTVLKISQADRPLDLVGHVVKMVFDDTDPISYALTLTDPYTTTGQFDIGPWSGHARRVFVQAVDELGNLSEAVSVALNLGDVETDNVLFTISEASKGWSGTVANGSIDGTTLKADETLYLWPQDDNAPLWPQDDSFPLWPSGGGLQMQYAWSINIPAAYAGARILVNPVASAGKLAKVEFRVYTQPPLWPQDDNAFLWPQNDSDYLWPQPMRSEWKAFPDTYITTGAETLAFRVTYAAGTAAILTDIETIIDVPDQEYALADLEIAADGTTHIPVPADTFRAVTNVVATLQYRSGDTAVMTAKVAGSETMGSNGYLTNGPLILALNSSRTGVSAVADVRIRGY